MQQPSSVAPATQAKTAEPKSKQSKRKQPEAQKDGDPIAIHKKAKRTKKKPEDAVVPEVPKKKDTKWLLMYDQLRKYKEEHGNTIVPRGYGLNPRLASWVAEQRKQYKLLTDDKQSSITPERIKLLNELGFAWNAQEAAWNRHMDDLKKFKEENGHCHVPLNHERYPKLGLWVKGKNGHRHWMTAWCKLLSLSSS